MDRLKYSKEIDELIVAFLKHLYFRWKLWQAAILLVSGAMVLDAYLSNRSPDWLIPVVGQLPVVIYGSWVRRYRERYKAGVFLTGKDEYIRFTEFAAKKLEINELWIIKELTQRPPEPKEKQEP
jgi:hypothetical protein